MEKKTNYLLLVLKGCAMGAADVIPGVSGGTIAFITGIYEELINSIKSIDIEALRLFFSLRLKAFWKKINGNFLLAVVSGIAISIFSLAKLMTYLLHTHEIVVWSFFFGLIIASCFLVAKEIRKWKATTIIALIAGGIAGYLVTALPATSTPHTWWFVMISGAIAICAMILPGISGAFILVLLGQYHFLMEAISKLNIGIMIAFVVGAIAGLISFSHLLSWLLKKYHSITIAVLIGFMVGSLNKVWPWKITSGDVTNNVLPNSYSQDPQLPYAILFCLAGFVLIWGFEAAAKKLEKRHK